MKLNEFIAAMNAAHETNQVKDPEVIIQDHVDNKYEIGKIEMEEGVEGHRKAKLIVHVS